jgi:RNA polymerase sigma factor (sigma-70 family)
MTLHPPLPLSAALASTPGYAGLAAAASAAVAAPDSAPARDALYEQLQPLVRRLLRQYGAEQAPLREEVSGQVYRDFCSLLTAYDPALGVPLLPYLTRSLSAGAFTFSLDRAQFERSEPVTALDSPASGMEHNTGAGCDHERLAAAVLKALPSVIARLPWDQRQVMVLRYYEGLSVEEIARRLLIGTPAAYSLLQVGLSELSTQVFDSASER